ncbi:MAG TPA: hypothetical protein VNZ64_23980 [Candidatus Acidoferrum sp.]|jgi:hypothetical protein|nr:hypothetical protein [Candidatus Acidoferrum sp.]
MDNLENAHSTQPDLNDLRAECASLRQSVFSLLVLLLVISGTLNVYFLRQFRVTKAAVAQVASVVADFQKNQGPAIDNFLARLVEFEKKNPDFAPILAKYGVRPGSSTGAPPATANSPAPAKK